MDDPTQLGRERDEIMRVNINNVLDVLMLVRADLC